ncbi:CDP-alcohol phosphatidyltransferase family protein [Brugia malayi]|uniref:Bm10269, isoform b n=2 Tax=Brugia TaxID=6278 RepID=A0A158PT89_BRUMA|nr:CDP-alcohol phosphatidyltransferase family protein [Brugia malayi]CDP97424.1 Bm10269, isoform b [Brugia malayi]VIO92775.1 CDP-alcohol phosphatidyltransferase family protein [Brugia malayi]
MICAICSFWSHTYDGIDGIQARRTSSVSPVGEFFDHALDACKVFPFIITLFAPFNESNSRISSLCSLALLIEMLTAHTFAFWEQYITKIMCLRWCFEGFYVSNLLHILAYFDGDNLVTACLFNNWKVCDLIMLIFNVCCISNILFSLYHIYQFYDSQPVSEKQSMICWIQPIIPALELNVAAFLWALFSPGKVLAQDLPIFLFTIAIVNANINSRLIVSHMSDSCAQMCNTAVMLYCSAALFSMTNILSAAGELLLLRSLAVFLFVAHVHYFFSIVREMCRKLQIEAFSLHYLKRSNMRKQG